MAEITGISWADSTANFWAGCQKVSPGCDHCYAETLMDTRFGRVKWGPHGERQRVAQGWRDLRKWQRAADRNGGIDPDLGRRRRVFINSLADFFDTHSTVPWRGEAWALFRECPSLDIMLLTKRPQNIAANLPDDWGQGWPNIWLGTTIENQTEADRRVPVLASVPAAIRFLSAEPLLGAIKIEDRYWREAIHWLIIGGESGDQARPMHPDWVTDLIEQAARAGVPQHFKQWGEWMPIIKMATIDNGHLTSRRAGRVCIAGRWYEGEDIHHFYDDQPMVRVGKATAGHLYYGTEIQEFPSCKN